MKRTLLTAVILILSTIAVQAQNSEITQGTLRALDGKGEIVDVPLKHTDVKANISGFIARVNVRQEFVNDFGRAIEAVYVFPLSHDGAVDRMSMRIGSRTINGVIMKREEARKTYEAAKEAGQTAALLDQERPNIFTQSVANILPGEKVIIEISYVETLKYEDGTYEFVFPMVVGPRYIPGNSGPSSEGGGQPDTDQVTDASRITPPVSKTRTGQDVSIEVNIDAGVPIERVTSELHQIQSQYLAQGNSLVKLTDDKTIPNKDFILRYDVTGKRIEDTVLAHRSGKGGFFTLILQPPDDMAAEDVTPKEIVFVLDTSGSMGGYPIEKAKEAMRLSIEGLHPQDTFNLITFAGSTQILFPKPVPATFANLEKAKKFLANTNGYGGTEMMTAIKAALDPTDSQEHLRIVCFMTDGYIGNDMAIIQEIQKHKNARVFSFGIGNSVNRYLLENMAKEGNGEAEIVTLDSESKAAAERFYKRVRTPLLTDLSIDWNGIEVDDVYPAKLTDLFTAKPVVVSGRFKGEESGVIKLKGKVAGQYYERSINVDFASASENHDVLATIWARRKVAELMKTNLEGIQNRNGDKEVEQQITNIGLEFGIMTQFTSFVAVEERAVNPGGETMRVDVPVENPDGHDTGKYKDWKSKDLRYTITGNSNQNAGTGLGSGSGGGFGSGTGAGKSNASPGTVSAAVTVSTGGTTVINTSNASISNKFKPEDIKSLPTNLRTVNVLMLSPGVTIEGYVAGISVDGASGSENVFVVDGQEISDFRSGVTTAGSNAAAADDLTTSLAELKKPEIPLKAKWGKSDDVVKVEFSVNDKGDVVKAKAVSGNRSLKKPSEEAAMGSKFTPPAFDGENLSMSGMLSYKFVDHENVEITLEEMKVELSTTQKRKFTKRYKLHWWVYELVERLDSGGTKPTEFEPQFVKDGVADVRIMLNAGVENGAAQLKKAGLEIYKESGKLVYGRVRIEKIYGLAELEAVKYISP